MFLTARSRVKRQTGQYWRTRVWDLEELKKIEIKFCLRDLHLAAYKISEELVVLLRFKRQQAKLRRELLE